MVLPFQASCEVLPPPATAPEMRGRRTRVTVEGDVITVLCRSAAARVWLTGGPGGEMARIPGTDVFARRVRVPGADRAFFRYGFAANENWAFPDFTWNGPNAPHPPARAARLRGRMLTTNLASPALGERRRVWAYLPPGSARGLPWFEITDGADVERFARVLEPLILARRVRPCAIVGPDNGGYRGDIVRGYDEGRNFRLKEYVPGVDPARFARHRRFFADEVPAWAVRAYGLSTRRADRAAMGYSDGARFLLALAADRPQALGATLALSPAAPFTRPYPANGPRLFLCGGRLESPIDRWAEALHTRVPGSTLVIFVAGHQPEPWDLAFARFAPRVFPRAENPSPWGGAGVGSRALRYRPRTPSLPSPKGEERDDLSYPLDSNRRADAAHGPP